MKKALKIIGVGSVAVAVAGAIACIIKKVKDIDDYQLPDDFEPSPDSVFHDDPFENDSFSDFNFDDIFPKGKTDDEFIQETGVSRNEVLSFLSKRLSKTGEDIGFLATDDLLIDMYNMCKDYEEKEKEEESNLDIFKMLCGVTREEAIKELVNYDSSMYVAEELEKLEDKELCQFYADYSVAQKGSSKNISK